MKKSTSLNLIACLFVAFVFTTPANAQDFGTKNGYTEIEWTYFTPDTKTGYTEVEWTYIVPDGIGRLQVYSSVKDKSGKGWIIIESFEYDPVLNVYMKIEMEK